jgi:nanoRNase/pAp phosphatase (c-di-AMP/oligoRNAs hydrolase)
MKDSDSKNKLLEEAIINLRTDREVATDLLYELRDDIVNGKTNHTAAGQTAAKYVETLQRSNEQLVKIISMIEKKEQKSSDDWAKMDKSSLYDMIKEQKKEL